MLDSQLMVFWEKPAEDLAFGDGAMERLTGFFGFRLWGGGEKHTQLRNPELYTESKNYACFRRLW